MQKKDLEGEVPKDTIDPHDEDNKNPEENKDNGNPDTKTSDGDAEEKKNAGDPNEKKNNGDPAGEGPSKTSDKPQDGDPKSPRSENGSTHIKPEHSGTSSGSGGANPAKNGAETSAEGAGNPPKRVDAEDEKFELISANLKSMIVLVDQIGEVLDQIKRDQQNIRAEFNRIKKQFEEKKKQWAQDRARLAGRLDAMEEHLGEDLNGEEPGTSNGQKQEDDDQKK